MTHPPSSGDDDPGEPGKAAARTDPPAGDRRSAPAESGMEASSQAASVRHGTSVLTRARQAVERFDAAQAQFARCSAAPARSEPRLPLQGLWGARSGNVSSNPRGGVATRAFPDAQGAIVAAGCCLLEDAGDHVRLTWPEGTGFRATMLARGDYDQHCQDGTLVE